MFGSVVAIGAFVLTVIAVSIALTLRDRGEMRRRQRRHASYAQRNNLKYRAHIGEIAPRPSSPRPNDIT